VCDPAVVRRADAVGQRDPQVEDAVERKAGVRDDLAERLPFDQLEGQEGNW
jgi:hypothetical protein